MNKNVECDIKIFAQYFYIKNIYPVTYTMLSTITNNKKDNINNHNKNEKMCPTCNDNHQPLYDITSLEMMKRLLKREEMQLLVEPTDMETEMFFGSKRNCDNASVGSNDTRCVFGKRKIDIVRFMMDAGIKLQYITSGATGHIFRGDVVRNGETKFQFSMKVSAYAKREKYGSITNIKRPENAETMMLKTLSYFVTNKLTPHLILPIITVYTDIRFLLVLSNSNHTEFIKKNKKKFDEFIKRYDMGKYEPIVSVLWSEWANRGDFLEFIKKRYDKFRLIHWKVFFFQILSVLAVIQSKCPTFRHNDMKANNILVHKIESEPKKFEYTIDSKKYIVDNISYQIKLWDFDFSCIKGVVDNIKVHEDWTNEINITSDENKYYDIHYFFNTLTKFFPDIMVKNSKYVPNEVIEFIGRVVPKKYRNEENVSEKGRILVNDEYTTPKKLLENDPFFSVFRTF